MLNWGRFAPYEQAKTVSRTFLFLWRSSIAKIKIWCPCCQRLRGHPNFSLDTVVFKFLYYWYWMCKHNQIPFFVWLSVSIVVDYVDTMFALSLAMLTQCLRSCWTLLTRCLCSHWLREHTFFAKIFAKTKKFAKSFFCRH